MSATREGPSPRVLREYALLADGERGAVVGPRGDLVWMCAPRWDSPSVFGALIGGRGAYVVEPLEQHVWGGFYQPASLIWNARWTTGSGRIESREALAFPGDPHRCVLLRRPTAVDGAARLRVMLRPRAGYDHDELRDVRHERGIWTGRVGPLYLRWTCGPGARARDGGTQLDLVLALDAGAHRDLVLEIADEPLPEELPDPDALWRATENAWANEVPAFDATLAPADARHSYAVLRGLTGVGGGAVAAATTSLPERAEAGRNYDYRYVWIRDQCYIGQAVGAAGPHGLLHDSVRFVTERLLTDGDRLRPAYTVEGGRIPEVRHLGLPGYPGGFDVVGNRVRSQFQLDVFGEALLLFATAARHDGLSPDTVRAADLAAAAIATRWPETDAGLWEIENRAWTHSRLIAAAGLRAIAAALPAVGADRLALADAIVADVAAHATHASGRWQRAYDDPRPDAALLLPALRGAVPADDPRSRATLAAYLDELTVDGYAYRFRHGERPLSDAEGAFLLCGFLTALSLQQQGDPVEARAWFERTRAACGPPELFSEEYDVAQHQMRGNLPQAFVHALMLEAAFRLAAPPVGCG